MAGATGDRAAGREAEAGRCTLTCDCWDCRAWRRHLLRVAALVLLACGVAGELGWQRGLWRAGGSDPDADAELAAAAVPSAAEPF